MSSAAPMHHSINPPSRSHYSSRTASQARFLASTNGSCFLERNANGSPPPPPPNDYAPHDQFLVDPPLLPLPVSTVFDGGGDGGYPVLPEEILPNGIWTAEVVFRVTTIAVLMALTLIGNTALISVITCHASLRRKRVGVFLLNLAVGDLMVCFVTMTTEILFVAFGEWVLGAVACKVIVYGQIVTLASTTFLLTAMSIDRYQVLVKPLQSLRGSPRVWRKMVLSWVLAMIFATPQLFVFVQAKDLRPTDGVIVLTCRSVGYTEKWQRKLYFSFMTSYILLIPTAIMSFCYISIIRIVWMRTGGAGGGGIDAPKIHFVTSRKADAPPGTNVPPPTAFHLKTTALLPPTTAEHGSSRANRLTLSARAALSSKRTVVKMTLSVIVGFVVCWTPYFVVSLVRIFSDYRIQISHALSVSEIMALAHSALNPILFMVFSTRALRNSCHRMRRSLTSCIALRRRPQRPRLSPEQSVVSEWNNVCRGAGVVAAGGSAVGVVRKCHFRTDGGGGGCVANTHHQQRRKCRRAFLTYTRRFLDSDTNLPLQQQQQQQLQQHGIQLFHPAANRGQQLFQEEALPIAEGRTRTTIPRGVSSNQSETTTERSANIDCYVRDA